VLPSLRGRAARSRPCPREELLQPAGGEEADIDDDRHDQDLGEPGKDEVPAKKKRIKDIPYDQMPIDKLGGAVVYAKPGEHLDPDALVDFLKAGLSSFKIPAKVWMSAEQLPKLGSAKIDKVSLRKQYRAVWADRAA
jgi:acyl-CoA synthetase (AMP-forming)/AMP-acid ligase II